MDITHRLDLALRCIDTASGRVIEGGVELSLDGRPVKPVVKPDGYLLLLGTGRQDLGLEIRAEGYERHTLRVEYEKLNPNLPLIEPELIPSPKRSAVEPLKTLEGRLEGLESIDAVRPEDNSCLFREMDARKRILTVFNPHRLALDRVSYALVNVNEPSYEPFTIEQRISDRAFKIDKPPAGVYTGTSPISRIIRGRVEDDGRYLLRVRDTSSGGRLIVRLTARGRQVFRLVDFSAPETMALAMPEE